MFNIDDVNSAYQKEFQETASELTAILLKKGAYKSKDIINDVNLVMKELSKVRESIELDDPDPFDSLGKNFLVNSRRYSFFIDCILIMAKQYDHHMKDIISDARKLAENIYGKFPE